MKQQLFNGLKIVIIGLALSAGISYAGNWVAPTGNPPGNNASGPVNVSSAGQVKGGGLGLNTLAVYFNSRFMGDVNVDKNIIVGNYSTDPATGGSVKIGSLSHSDSSDKHVCATQDGALYLCGATPPVYTPQCRDFIDNDGDGLIDFPSDPGCSSPSDDDEYNSPTTLYQCNDGVDNDGDGQIDFPADKGCDSPTDNTELAQGIKGFYDPGYYEWVPSTSELGGQSSRVADFYVWGAGAGGGGGGKTSVSSISTGTNCYYGGASNNIMMGFCNGGAGGGGGGGYLKKTSITINAGLTYKVTVGVGGAGGAGGQVSPTSCGLSPCNIRGGTGGIGGISKIEIPGGATYQATGGTGGLGGYVSGYASVQPADQIACTGCGGVGGSPNTGGYNNGGRPKLGQFFSPTGGRGASDGSLVYSEGGGDGGHFCDGNQCYNSFSVIPNFLPNTNHGKTLPNDIPSKRFGSGGGGAGGHTVSVSSTTNNGGKGAGGAVEILWNY